MFYFTTTYQIFLTQAWFGFSSPLLDFSNLIHLSIIAWMWNFTLKKSFLFAYQFTKLVVVYKLHCLILPIVSGSCIVILRVVTYIFLAPKPCEGFLVCVSVSYCYWLNWIFRVYFHWKKISYFCLKKSVS